MNVLLRQYFRASLSLVVVRELVRRVASRQVRDLVVHKLRHLVGSAVLDKLGSWIGAAYGGFVAAPVVSSATRLSVDIGHYRIYFLIIFRIIFIFWILFILRDTDSLLVRNKGARTRSVRVGRSVSTLEARLALPRSGHVAIGTAIELFRMVLQRGVLLLLRSRLLLVYLWHLDRGGGNVLFGQVMTVVL